ncbi:MAG: type transport system permease protein [Bacteroidales bacterium]|jgi:ABC-2 type transport system permease protein|nr:type transport system permease protein [Bacteroidales bacterium]MDN5328835.1 type transport system permease protein [Bacteroidales bacterium]
MKKTWIIIQREYLTRVKKKSFIIMTILGPLLMAGLWIIPIYISTLGQGKKVVQVLDESGLFIDKFVSTENIRFVPVLLKLEEAKQAFLVSNDDALLYIPRTELSLPVTALLFARSQPGMDLKAVVRDIMRRQAEALKLRAKGMDPEVLNTVKTRIILNTVKLADDGTEEKTSVEVSMALGLVGGFFIYFLIFLFGSQVMRGVIEEKANRIIEVIITSVKPFQLMAGKIIGVGLVGLTQFLIWVVFTGVLILGFQATQSDSLKNAPKHTPITTQKVLPPQQMQLVAEAEVEADKTLLEEAMEGIRQVNFPLVLGAFAFFFLGGYLLYAALFAAIGSAVESEADTQQFMLPVTVPLILSFILATYVINNPNSSLAIWFSIIPLTSPVVMMVRIPFGVPWWHLALSMLLLVVGFVFTTWLAARIYRTGILMYGKKVTWAELIRWFKYKV